jgi:hypothetical protein
VAQNEPRKTRKQSSRTNLLNPLKGLSLIQETAIGSYSIPISHKPIRSDAVVDLDHNDRVVTSSDQAASIIVGICKTVESSTLDEEING